ncbi:fumarate hydratase C-terminal domain-containing protein [Pseudomonas aeruginosa]
MAAGGAAYLVAQAIKKSKVLAFAELGMEAIYEFEVEGHAGHRRGRYQRRVGATSPARRGLAEEDRRKPGGCRGSSKPAPSLESPRRAPGSRTAMARSADWQRAAGAAGSAGTEYSKVRFAAEIRPNNDQASALTQRGLSGIPP